MNKWMISNNNVRAINTLVVTNGHAQVLRSDGSAFTSPIGDYDCFYLHHYNSCCLTGLMILAVEKASPLSKAEQLGEYSSEHTLK